MINQNQLEVCLAWTGTAGKIIATYAVERLGNIGLDGTVPCNVVRFVRCKVLPDTQVYANMREIVPDCAREEVGMLLRRTIDLPSEVVAGGTVFYMQNPRCQRQGEGEKGGGSL